MFMLYLQSTLVLLAGIVFGSFFNAVVWRYRRREKITARHSICVHCGHTLAAGDLIPVLSYLALRGRCRYCHKPIPFFYPLVELATGLVLLLPLAFFGFTLAFVVVAAFSLLLELLFLLDLRYSILPDELTVPAIILGILVGFTIGREYRDILLGGILGAGFFLLQYAISRGRWIGGGDIRLGAVMGCALGVNALLLALFFSYCVGAIVGVILISSKQKRWKSHIPFGTFLTASTYVLLLAGTSAGTWMTTLVFKLPAFG